MDVENDDDTFRILVATDTHLGYMERDGNRGEDSFVAFEEVLQLAQSNNADFVLLGGDLFHENKPSKSALTKCVRLLKKYCLGSRPVKFEYLGDPSENFSVSEPRVNFHDPDLNICLPVFSIHGNHDDLSGPGDTAALDILSEAGLVNYFGRCTDLRSIQLSPLLLQKGATRLAIYGLSNIKDERLFRLMRSEKVSFLRPREHTDDWFNIFVLHQNRVKHGATNYIPEEFLQSFLDVAIWGHEHENRIRPEFCETATVHIIQPGSSVATSLCEGEAVPKAVGLLAVRPGGQFRLHELPLRTVRPLVFDSLALSQTKLLSDGAAALGADVEKFIAKHVEKLIEKADSLFTGDARQPKLPLVRLRVEYPTHLNMFHPVRFGQRFSGRVANPNDLILLRKEKPDHKGSTIKPGDMSIMQGAAQERESDIRVEDYVKQCLSEKASESGVDTLAVLSETGVTEAVHQFVVKGNTHSFEVLLQEQLKKAASYLDSRELLQVSEESLRQQIAEWRRQKRAQRSVAAAAAQSRDMTSLSANGADKQDGVVDERSEIREMLESVSRSQATRPAPGDRVDGSDDADSNDDMMDTRVAPPAVGRRGARGRGSRGRRASRALSGRGAAGDSRNQSVGGPTGRSSRVADTSQMTLDDLGPRNRATGRSSSVRLARADDGVSSIFDD